MNHRIFTQDHFPTTSTKQQCSISQTRKPRPRLHAFQVEQIGPDSMLFSRTNRTPRSRTGPDSSHKQGPRKTGGQVPSPLTPSPSPLSALQIFLGPSHSHSRLPGNSGLLGGRREEPKLSEEGKGGSQDQHSFLRKLRSGKGPQPCELGGLGARLISAPHLQLNLEQDPSSF